MRKSHPSSLKSLSGKRLANKILKILEDMQAEDTLLLNVKKVSSLFDYFIVTSGHSTRHAQAMADKIIESLSSLGLKPLGIEGINPGDWILLDYGDAVVHIMQPKARSFYQLEELWSHSPSGSLK